MAYSVTNPPRLVIDHGLSGFSNGMFMYWSTDDHSTVSGDGYFSDGSKYGMRVGDVVIVVKTDTGATTLHSVTAVADKVGVGAVADNTPRAVTISAATFT